RTGWSARWTKANRLGFFVVRHWRWWSTSSRRRLGIRPRPTPAKRSEAARSETRTVTCSNPLSVSAARGGAPPIAADPASSAGCRGRRRAAVPAAARADAARARRATTVQRTRHDGRVRARRVQLDRVLPERTLDRFVRFRVRTVLGLLGILLVVFVALWVVWVARHV